MNKEEKQKFIASIKAVYLLPEEKESIRGKILAQINPNALGTVSPDVFSLPLTGFRFFFYKMRYATLILLVFVIGAGVSYAAEKSLPGDPLYNVKIGFSEKIAGVFVTGSFSKAKREVKLIDKRLEEVQSLALRGQFSEEKVSSIENGIVLHTERVKEYIKTLENEERYEEVLHLGNQLETSFSENKKILKGLISKFGEVAPIALRVREGLSEFSIKRSITESSLKEKTEADVVAISEESLKTALLSLSEIEGDIIKEIGNLDEGYTPDTALYIEEYLELAKEKIEEGEALLGIKFYSEAISVFGEATRLINDAKSLLEAETRFDVQLEPSKEILNRLEVKEKEVIEVFPETESELSPNGEVKGEFRSRDVSKGALPVEILNNEVNDKETKKLPDIISINRSN